MAASATAASLPMPELPPGDDDDLVVGHGATLRGGAVASPHERHRSRAGHPGGHRRGAAGQRPRSRDPDAAPQRGARLRRRHVGWPGGRLDPGDYDAGEPSEDPAPSKPSRPAGRGRARRARRPTSLVDPDALVWFSHWTPPTDRAPSASPRGSSPRRRRRGRRAHRRRRDPRPRVDDPGRCHAPAATPSRSSCRRPRGSPCDSSPASRPAAEALAALAARPPEHFATRIAGVEGGAVALYHGDAGYEDERPRASADPATGCGCCPTAGATSARPTLLLRRPAPPGPPPRPPARPGPAHRPTSSMW